MDRSPLAGLNAQSKTGRCCGLRCGAPSMVSCSIEEGEDLVDLLRAVAELAQGGRHGLVDDLEEALADELLVLDERDVRLNAGGIAIHHEGDGPGGRQHGHLGVPVAELLAQLERLVVDLGRVAQEVLGHAGGRDRVGRVAVLLDDPQERRLVDLVLGERAAVVAGDDARLLVRLAVHDRGQGGGEVAALVGVVGEAAAHEQGAEVGIAEPERAELVRVLLDLRRRVADALSTRISWAVMVSLAA